MSQARYLIRRKPAGTLAAESLGTERFGYLMAERETTAWNAVKALQTPEKKGWRVFDGYLMGDGFASCQSPQMSLDKMTPNQPSFVKNSARQKRAKRREPLHFSKFPFDTNGIESSAACSLDWSITRA